MELSFFIWTFLGISNEHSSLVVNVRNLQTMYVSPQYHCVFDNLFETIFSSKSYTHALNNICDKMFQDIRHWYDEE